MATLRTTPWEVLGLDPAWFVGLSAATSETSMSTTAPTPVAADAATRSALLRRAYRRALLQHHPDKRRQPGLAATSVRPGRPAGGFTVDDIKAAYAALGGDSTSAGAAHSNANCDANSSNPVLAPGLGAGVALPTATGLEVVDLDELPFDADAQVWYRSCRCGNARGFAFGEQDLEEELDAEALETLVDGNNGSADARRPLAAGELLVGCQDCSLWLCVHFAVAPDDENDEDNEGNATA